MPFDRASCDRASLVFKYSSSEIFPLLRSCFNSSICCLYNLSLSLAVIVAGANEPGGSSDVDDDAIECGCAGAVYDAGGN